MTTKKVLEYIARPTGAVVTLVLLTFAVFFSQLLVAGLVLLYTYEKKPHFKPPDDLEWKTHNASKLFLPDATMHLVHGMDMQNYDVYTKEEITDVNGNVLWQGIRKERPFKYLDWASWPTGLFDERAMRGMSLLTPDSPAVCEVPVRVGEEIKEVWRYDFESETFAGYEVGGVLMGYLGADGFTASRIQPFGEFKCFASWTDENPASVVMLWQTKRRIYQIDFRSRKVKTVFDSAQSDIVSIKWHQWRPMYPEDHDDSGIQYRPLIDCITADNRHNLIMREPNQIITVDTHWGLNAEFTATSDAIFLRYHEKNFNPPKSKKLLEQYYREYNSKPQPQSLQLYKVVDDGKLELVNQFDWTKPAEKTSYRLRREVTILKWVKKTSPPVFDLLWYLFGDGLYEFKEERMGMMSQYAGTIIFWRPDYSALNYLLSVAMMGFALWHGWARRTSRIKLILWLIIVGAFNLAGLLTYLGLNHTPVIRCPVCGKKRGLETLDCIRCGSNLPIPQRKPTDLILAT